MNTVSTEELKELIDSNGKYILIDVRQKEELSYGMIKTAHHIALPDLEQALSMKRDEFFKKYGFEILKKGTIIFYCRSGNRSRIAAAIARKKGINAFNYEGSILEWSHIDPKVHAY